MATAWCIVACVVTNFVRGIFSENSTDIPLSLVSFCPVFFFTKLALVTYSIIAHTEV